ncbi:ATP-dependent DNA ligase [Lactifluus volemus]|nr:ATP-dependent DNA ligase [Lactifluus volemus]KAH9959286.1 ATP-dependent DNA ligase [Lactifluus volemus]KAH9972003.1 ATP-dependent DNA ligase [Lactifluus volemus]
MVKGKAVATAEDEDMDMEDVGRKGAAEGPERMRRNGKLCQKGGVEAALDWRDEIDVKGWKIGDLVPYAALAKAFALIEVTTKQLEKTSLLTGLMLLIIQRHKAADTRANSLLRMVYLCIIRLCPDYTGIELRIGESLLIKAIGKSTGRSLQLINQT